MGLQRVCFADLWCLTFHITVSNVQTSQCSAWIDWLDFQVGDGSKPFEPHQKGWSTTKLTQNHVEAVQMTLKRLTINMFYVLFERGHQLSALFTTNPWVLCSCEPSACSPMSPGAGHRNSSLQAPARNGRSYFVGLWWMAYGTRLIKKDNQGQLYFIQTQHDMTLRYLTSPYVALHTHTHSIYGVRFYRLVIVTPGTLECFRLASGPDLGSIRHSHSPILESTPVLR